MEPNGVRPDPADNAKTRKNESNTEQTNLVEKLSNLKLNKGAPDDAADAAEKTAGSSGKKLHKLHASYTFWYHEKLKYGQPFEDGLEPLGSFSTVEDFWSFYSYLIRPSRLKRGSDYLLFLKDIRPMWEDPKNINGGKWVIRVKKPLASRVWEDLILAIIGNRFGLGEEIRGCIISCRQMEYVISVWHANSRSQRVINTIRDTLRKLFEIDPSLSALEYKRHGTSMKQAIDYLSTRHQTDRNSYYARQLRQMPRRMNYRDNRDGGGGGYNNRDGNRDRDYNNRDHRDNYQPEYSRYGRGDRYDRSHRQPYRDTGGGGGDRRFTPRDSPRGPQPRDGAGDRFAPRDRDGDRFTPRDRDDRFPPRDRDRDDRFAPRDRDRERDRDGGDRRGAPRERYDRFAAPSSRPAASPSEAYRDAGPNDSRSPALRGKDSPVVRKFEKSGQPPSKRPDDT